MAPARSQRQNRPIQTVSELEERDPPFIRLRKFAASPEITEIYIALRPNEIAGFRPPGKGTNGFFAQED